MGRPSTTAQVQRELGRRLREARRAAALTQERAAAEAGIDYKRYQRLEQGSVNATLETLVRVAAALRTDFFGLVAGEAGAAWERRGAQAVREAAGGDEPRSRSTLTRVLPADVARVSAALSRRRERARWLRFVAPAPRAELEEALAHAAASAGGARLVLALRGCEVALSIAARPGGRAIVSARIRGPAREAAACRDALAQALDALRAQLAG